MLVAGIYHHAIARVIRLASLPSSVRIRLRRARPHGAISVNNGPQPVQEAQRPTHGVQLVGSIPVLEITPIDDHMPRTRPLFTAGSAVHAQPTSLRRRETGTNRGNVNVVY